MGHLNAGQLKERITLRATGTTTPDGRGGFTATGPETLLDLWARVRPLSGNEKLLLGQTVNTEAYEITIRRQPTASAKQRITWKGKTLNVQAVAPDEDYEFQRLSCFSDGQ